MFQGISNLGMLKKDKATIKRMKGKISQRSETWMSNRVGRGMNYKNLCVHWHYHQDLEIPATEAENNTSTGKKIFSALFLSWSNKGQERLGFQLHRAAGM